MARLAFLSFLFAFLILLISPLSPAAVVAAPSGTYTAPSGTYTLDAGAEATVTEDPVLDSVLGENAVFSSAQEEAVGTQPRGDVQPREMDRKARSMRNLIASGVAMLLLPVIAMLVDSGYILSKVEDLQEEDPKMTDEEAYEKVLSNNTPAAVMSGLLAFLAVAVGTNFAFQAGKLLVSMKRERDQKNFEESADMK